MTYGNVSRGTLAKLSPQRPSHGRPTKFTPERLQQIRNLVERGKSREEIAEILDVTVG
jgi:DNA-binding NarL/FixJ family response regulator